MDLNFPKEGSFPSFDSVLSHHLLSLVDDDKEINELFDCFGTPEEALVSIYSLKEQGNSFFKNNLFCDASKTYLKAIKFLCVIVTAISEILQGQDRETIIKELAIPLHLNFAICALKMSKFKEAILFSSMVLGMDSANVKALYRRGLSYAKSSCFEEARLDLSRAKKLEGRNIEISKSLQFVEETLKGKTSLTWEVQSSSSSPSPMDFSDLGNSHLSSMAKRKVSKSRVCVAESDTSSPDPSYQSSTDLDVLIEKPQQSNRKKTKISSPLEVETKVSSVEVIALEDRAQESQRNSSDVIENSVPSKDIHTSKTSGPNSQAPRPSSKNLPSKGKVVFINRKKPGTSLQLSREDVNRLRNGKELSFFNSHSLTTLKVKTFKKIQIPSQMDDLMEAHQNHQVRVAEVSECEDNLSANRSVEDSKDLITLSKDEPNSIVEVCPVVLQVESKVVEDFQVKILPYCSANTSPTTPQAKIFSSPHKGGKKTKSRGSNAVLAAKKRALRVARYKLGAVKGQQQDQHSRRKHGTGHKLQKVTNSQLVGVKRSCLPWQNDASTPTKKTCNGISNSKLEGATQCKFFSFSNFQGDGTDSSNPKPAHDIAWAARCML